MHRDRSGRQSGAPAVKQMPGSVQAAAAKMHTSQHVRLHEIQRLCTGSGQLDADWQPLSCPSQAASV